MFFKRKSGASSAELALLVSLVVVVIIGAIALTGKSLDRLLLTAADEIASYGVSNEVVVPPTPEEPAVLEAPANTILTQYQLYDQAFTLENVSEEAVLEVTSSNASVLSASNINLGTVEFPFLSFSTSASNDGTTLITLKVTDGDTVLSDSFSVTINRAVSCDQLSGLGVAANGIYTIDPDGKDGSFGLSNISVECDFTTAGGPWTVIGHDKEAGESFVGTGCVYHTCKLMDLTYDIDETALEYMAANATAIEQDFRMDCSGAYLVAPYTASNSLINATFLTGLGSNQKFIARTEYFPGTIPCDDNQVGAKSYSTRLKDHFDILPLKTLWGGDVDGGSEQATFTIGKTYLRFNKVTEAPIAPVLPAFTVTPIADIAIDLGQELRINAVSSRDEAVVRFIQNKEGAGNFISPIINSIAGGYNFFGTANAAGTGTVTVEFYDAGETITETVNVYVAYPESCLEWYNRGARTTGDYYVDPDGAAGAIDPVLVTCNMSNSKATEAGLSAYGWMEIANNREGTSGDGNTCATSSCKVFDVTYYDATGAALPEAILQAFVDQSSTIAQNFFKSCFGSVITKEYGSGTIYGNYITKLGGSSPVALSTVSHYDNVAPDCDVNDQSWRSSDKFFVNKTDILPIKSLWGGDSDADATEHSSYKIGKLYLR